MKSVKTPVKIRVDSATRQALRDIGWKGESYDDVIRRLIDHFVKAQIHEGAAPFRELLAEEEEVKKR